MHKMSAGIVLYRRSATGLEVFLVHPGGPFWRSKDAGSWSIPKGEYIEGEEPLSAARREFCEDESFFVLSGIFEITVGGKTTSGGPGTYAYGPRGVPHQWTNMGSGRGQLLNVYTPGGIDKFFLAVGIPIHASTEQPQVDLAAYDVRIKRLREKTGIIRLGPPKYP
jgi:mannose-6-phosphate isomerase-like protein (cupin superfamily)